MPTTLHSLAALPLLLALARGQDAPVPGSAETVYPIGRDVTAPSLISKLEPSYSDEARKAKISGSILLSVVVGSDGVTRDLKVVRPLGFHLDEEAIKAVSQWKFRPGVRDGRPVAVRANIEVSFRLLDNPAAAAIAANSSDPPDTPEQGFRRAISLSRHNNPDAAILMFSKTINLNPNWAQPYAAKAQVEYRVKRYAEAIDDFSRAIAQDATKPNWFDERGLAYAYSGQSAKALEDYNHAIEMSPHPPANFFTNRGSVYLKSGDYEKAIADLSNAILLNPALEKAYEDRAAAYTSKSDWKNAAADRAAVTDLNPTAETYSKLAEARQTAGNSSGATEARRAAVESAPRPAALPAGFNLLDSDPYNPDLKAPDLLTPIDQQEFDNFPRRTVLNWSPVLDAVAYVVEWDYSSGGAWTMETAHHRVGYSASGTTFVLEFIGAQPGRWRVFAVDAQARRGPPSEWRTFTYLK